MIQEISLEYVTFYSNCLCASLKNYVEEHQTSRIKEIVSYIFSKLSSFFNFFNRHSKEVNLLPVAMIGCISLACILVISMLWKGEKSPMLPPSPMK